MAMKFLLYLVSLMVFFTNQIVLASDGNGYLFSGEVVKVFQSEKDVFERLKGTPLAQILESVNTLVSYIKTNPLF